MRCVAAIFLCHTMFKEMTKTLYSFPMHEYFIDWLSENLI